MKDKHQTVVINTPDVKQQILTTPTRSTPSRKPYMERFLVTTLVNEEGKEIKTQQNMCKTSN